MTKKELEREISHYNYILNELYEDYDEYGDEYEQIPMYEKLLKEAQEKLEDLDNNLQKGE